MAAFDMRLFYRILRETPKKHILSASPEYSEYLQKEVFDPLIRGETIDLANLDWNAIAPCYVTIRYLREEHEGMEHGLIKRTKQLLQQTVPSRPLERKFF